MYGEMIKKFIKIQPKMTCTLEGGYNLNWIGKCLVSQVGAMVGKPVNFDEKVNEEEDLEDLIKGLKNRLDSHWNI
jgi:acetoin utilization deacetylase AcuC-like enzyme